MKRIINGFAVDWASERVFAEQQAAPNYGYLWLRARERWPSRLVATAAAIRLTPLGLL